MVAAAAVRKALADRWAFVAPRAFEVRLRYLVGSESRDHRMGR